MYAWKTINFIWNIFNNYAFMIIILFEFNQYLKYNAWKKYLAISNFFTSEKN
jgi:hypothetical protein